jgi:hypothetical protein
MKVDQIVMQFRLELAISIFLGPILGFQLTLN